MGSQPGRIVQGLRQAKSNDPVLLLDEIDKVSAADFWLNLEILTFGVVGADLNFEF